MISNDRQYQQTRKKLGELKQLLMSVEAGNAGAEGFRILQAQALESQMGDLREELDEYELLRNGNPVTIESTSLAGLADALIKARIARGLTQANLGEALGVAEQQIQRYEAARYSTASLARLCDVAEALNVTVSEVITLKAS